jgi:hypothetical protein
MVLKVKNIHRDGKQSFVNLCICVRANKITALYPSTSLTLPPTVDIPIICQGITGRRPYSLKRMKNKISQYGLYITKTVYYKVSCGVVIGWVLKATVDRGSDPAGALCELPRLFGGNSHSDDAFNFCPDGRVHWLPRR